MKALSVKNAKQKKKERIDMCGSCRTPKTEPIAVGNKAKLVFLDEQLMIAVQKLEKRVSELTISNDLLSTEIKALKEKMLAIQGINKKDE